MINIERVKKSRLAEVDFDNLLFGKVFSDHVFSAEYDLGEWKNLKIAPYEKISVYPGMAAFHYAQLIFEGMKAYKNERGDIHLFRPSENIKRFNRSAERMCMPTLPEEMFMDALSQLVNLDRQWIPSDAGASLYIRPFMFATEEVIKVKKSDSYRFMIITAPAIKYYANPIRLKVETQYTRAVSGGVGFTKAAGNYGASIYPTSIAQENGYNQLIWTDSKEHKYIEEAGTMNIFFLIGDTLVTPPLSDHILAGITRDSVLTIARSWGVKLEERPVSVDEILDAYRKGSLKEAFGTGTAVTIAHIEVIGYEGKNYVLPPPASREFSNKLVGHLYGIRKGHVEDTFNWMVKVS